MGDQDSGHYTAHDSTVGVLGVNQGTVHINLPTPEQRLHQLRAPLGDFTGRAREINKLIQALTTGDGAVIFGVRGMGGIGKTELAFVVANRLRDHFPDAQIVVELFGASDPISPEHALQNILRTLDPQAKLPDDLSTLKQIYTAYLNGKRTLILADDAKDETQVRPLLPPTGCALLITSRSHIELPGMQTHGLGTLSPIEAEELLLKICPRIGEHAPVLARLCGYLPLALRVSATFLKRRPTRPVEEYLLNLRNEHYRLFHLHDPKDLALSVEASLSLSYDALSSEMQQAFVQLGAFVDSFTLEAAEAVIQVDRSTTAEMLEELYLNSLLDFDEASFRYDLHDLVRDFAATHLHKQGRMYDTKLRYSCYFSNLFQYGIYSGESISEEKRAHALNLERVHISETFRWLLSQANNTKERKKTTRLPFHEARLRHGIYYSQIVNSVLERNGEIEDKDIASINRELLQILHALNWLLSYAQEASENQEE